MNHENRDSYRMFFGEKIDQVSLQDIKESRFSFVIQNIVQDFGLQKLVVLDQIHSSKGFCVDDTTLLRPASWFELQGDFLVTNQKNVALIILTGDCVPLVLYDAAHHAIGLVHAGWRSSYLGVLSQALQMMQQKYATDVSDLICTFGPSARDCCYEVGQQFVDDFVSKYPTVATFTKKNSKWYFDNSFFLQELLKKFGIKPQNIYTSKALCTICNPRFCSFRQEREFAGRQITMVALHDNK